MNRLLLLAILLSFAACFAAVAEPGSKALWEAFPVAANDTHSSLQPATDGSLVVWADDRDHPGGQGHLREIYSYDVSSGATKRLTEVTSDKMRPRIDQGWVVWNDVRNGNQDVYGLEVSSGREVAVADGASNQTGQDISYPWVVYQDDEHSREQMDVWAYNLETEERRLLTPGEGRMTLPRIGGLLVAWVEVLAVDNTSSVSQSIVHVHHLEAEETRTASVVPGEKSWVDVAFPFVVWQDYRAGAQARDIYAYDWGRGEEFAVVSGPGEQLRPQLAFPILAWTDVQVVDNKSLAYKLHARDISKADSVHELDTGGESFHWTSLSVGRGFAAWESERASGGDGATDIWAAAVLEVVPENPVSASQAPAQIVTEVAPPIEPQGADGSRNVLPWAGPAALLLVLGSVCAWRRDHGPF